VDRAGLVEEGLDDPPGVLDAVLAGEAGRVALQSVAQQPLVGLLAGPEGPLEVHLQLDRVADQALSWLLGLHARRHPVGWAEAEAQEVGAGLAPVR